MSGPLSGLLQQIPGTPDFGGGVCPPGVVQQSDPPNLENRRCGKHSVLSTCNRQTPPIQFSLLGGLPVARQSVPPKIKGPREALQQSDPPNTEGPCNSQTPQKSKAPEKPCNNETPQKRKGPATVRPPKNQGPQRSPATIRSPEPAGTKTE